MDGHSRSSRTSSWSALWRSLTHETVYLNLLADRLETPNTIRGAMASYSGEGPHAALDRRTLDETTRD